jgi:hypothetical protein
VVGRRSPAKEGTAVSRSKRWGAAAFLVLAFVVWFADPALAQTVTGPEVTWDVPSALQQWEVISGALLALAIAVVTKATMPKGVKVAIAFAVSLLFTVLKEAIAGNLAGDLDLVTTVLKVFALTVVFYEATWKPLGLAPLVEGATTLTDATARRLSFAKAKAAWVSPPRDQDDAALAAAGRR